mmetsp:Transcript_1090/g.2675  ORF Transcript_1090/g.2675 Transcript_1090/m.2675 type:complete len:88 (-) Transcript_1090:244-507(-)
MPATFIAFLFAVSACFVEWCPEDKKGNSACDFSCMTQSCGWDGLDCAAECTCNGDLLGNGQCDEACNTWKCSFDGGDCSLCKAGCEL